MVKSGIIVDATIVSSSRRPKKIIEIAEEDRKESDTEASEEKQESHKVVYSKDVDAGWIKKRNQYYYGHKVHIICKWINNSHYNTKCHTLRCNCIS